MEETRFEVDRADLLSRFADDEELLLEIVEIFLEEQVGQLSAISAAIEAGDAEALRGAAHTFKGAVSHFGAEAAREAAHRLETIGRSGDLTGAPAAWRELEARAGEVARALREVAPDPSRS